MGRARPILLVFTLGSESECERRPLLPQPLRQLERELRDRCLAQVLDAGREVGFELEVASPAAWPTVGPTSRGSIRLQRQTGATFGERVRRALRSCWENHPEGPIVLVGSDTPELGARHLLRALESVRHDPEAVVVGPSPDGGFYLVAAARPFEAALAQVRWCGAHAREDLVGALERMGRTVVLLEPLTDLDRPHNLLALLARDSVAVLAPLLTRRIRDALRALARPLDALLTSHRLVDLATVRLLRGPPVRDLEPRRGGRFLTAR